MSPFKWLKCCLLLFLTACELPTDGVVVLITPEDFTPTEVSIGHVSTNLAIRSKSDKASVLYSVSAVDNTLITANVVCGGTSNRGRKCQLSEIVNRKLDLIPSVVSLETRTGSRFYFAGRSRGAGDNLTIGRMESEKSQIEYARFRVRFSPTQALIGRQERYMYLIEANNNYVISIDLQKAFRSGDEFDRGLRRIEIEGKVVSAALYPGGKRLAVVTQRGIVLIKDLPSGRTLSSFRHFPRPPVTTGVGIEPGRVAGPPGGNYMYVTDVNNEYIATYELNAQRLHPRMKSFPLINFSPLLVDVAQGPRRKGYPFTPSTKITVSGNGSWVYVWRQFLEQINVYILRDRFWLKVVAGIKVRAPIGELATNNLGDIVAIAPVNEKKVILYFRSF